VFSFSYFSEYGRTCKDIGCRTDETCVMAEDPCTDYTDKCGRYPTCRRTSGKDIIANLSQQFQQLIL